MQLLEVSAAVAVGWRVYHRNGDGRWSLPHGTWFGLYEFVIKFVSAGALQCVAFPLCANVQLWVSGLMACFCNANVHSKHLELDVFMKMDKSK